jgi:hypothetical protein
MLRHAPNVACQGQLQHMLMAQLTAATYRNQQTDVVSAMFAMPSLSGLTALTAEGDDLGVVAPVRRALCRLHPAGVLSPTGGFMRLCRCLPQSCPFLVLAVSEGINLGGIYWHHAWPMHIRERAQSRNVLKMLSCINHIGQACDPGQSGCDWVQGRSGSLA